jgi:hypothetical protein
MIRRYAAGALVASTPVAAWRAEAATIAAARRRPGRRLRGA